MQESNRETTRNFPLRPAPPQGRFVLNGYLNHLLSFIGVLSSFFRTSPAANPLFIGQVAHYRADNTRGGPI